MHFVPHSIDPCIRKLHDELSSVAESCLELKKRVKKIEQQVEKHDSKLPEHDTSLETHDQSLKSHHHSIETCGNTLGWIEIIQSRIQYELKY